MTLDEHTEIFLIKLAIAHLMRENGGKIFIPFDLESFTQGKEPTVIDNNLLADSEKPFQYNRVEGGYKISLPPFPGASKLKSI